MHPPYYELPFPRGNGSEIPTGKANCIVNELIDYKGQTQRHQIGYAKTSKPLQAPIYADTLLGFLEIVNMDEADALHTAVAPKRPFAQLETQEDITFFEEEELTQHDW